MWKMKCFVILVISGAIEIVFKGLKKSGNNIRKKLNALYSLEKNC
jgi:hypothetical protein